MWKAKETGHSMLREWNIFSKQTGSMETRNDCLHFCHSSGHKRTNYWQTQKPGEKTYAEVVAELKKHYDPQPSEIMQRFQFHTRIRKTEESFGMYLAELAQKCNFRSDTLNEMLRDRLV